MTDKEREIHDRLLRLDESRLDFKLWSVLETAHLDNTEDELKQPEGK